MTESSLTLITWMPSLSYPSHAFPVLSTVMDFTCHLARPSFFPGPGVICFVDRDECMQWNTPTWEETQASFFVPAHKVTFRMGFSSSEISGNFSSVCED